MALWTDAIFVSEADLKSIDPEIGEIAATEGFTLSGPQGIITQGLADAALELTSTALQSFQSYMAPAGIPWNHFLAVMNIGQGSPYGNTYRIYLSQVVVTNNPTFGGWSALKRWVVYLVLNRFYNAATNRKDPDRFEKKWAKINDEIENRIRPFLFSSGIPIISTPLHAPGAVMEPDSGTWSAANVSLIDVPGTPAMDVDIAISYTGEQYQGHTDQKNSESYPSERVRVTIPGNKALALDISSLNPPTGVQPASTRHLGVYMPMKATGWNIWVGKRNGLLIAQNPLPLPISVKTYSFTAAPLLTGIVVGEGQFPDMSFNISKTMMRG